MEPAAADDPAAHARLAGDVDEVVDAGRGGLQVLGHGTEFGVVLQAQRGRPAPQAGADPADRGDVAPADVRGVDDGARRDVHDSGSGDGDPGRGDRGRVEGGEGFADQPGGAVQDGLGPGAADVQGDPPLEDGVPAQGQGHGGQVVDVDLQADPAQRAAVDPDALAGAPDRAVPLGVPLADQAEFDELGDQPGDRGPRQPRVIGDPGPGTRSGVAQEAQHETEIGAADGGPAAGLAGPLITTGPMPASPCPPSSPPRRTLRGSVLTGTPHCRPPRVCHPWTRAPPVPSRLPFGSGCGTRPEWMRHAGLTRLSLIQILTKLIARR